jgi:hypothetical protein
LSPSNPQSGKKKKASKGVISAVDGILEVNIMSKQVKAEFEMSQKIIVECLSDSALDNSRHPACKGSLSQLFIDCVINLVTSN